MTAMPGETAKGRVTTVTVALGSTAVDACTTGDGEITIDEILIVVNNALNGYVQNP
jgi:hypothetical protein